MSIRLSMPRKASVAAASAVSFSPLPIQLKRTFSAAASQQARKQVHADQLLGVDFRMFDRVLIGDDFVGHAGTSWLRSVCVVVALIDL
jgi:hypothetical protein